MWAVCTWTRFPPPPPAFLSAWKSKWEQECIPVGCIPPACWLYRSMHCTGGCLTRGCLPRGCLPRSVSAPGRCLPRGVSAQGVSAPGGYPSMQCGRPTLWTDRHLWKHNLRKLRLRRNPTISRNKAKWGSPPWLWNPWQTLAVQNKGINDPTNGLVSSNNLEIRHFCRSFELWSSPCSGALFMTASLLFCRAMVLGSQ